MQNVERSVRSYPEDGARAARAAVECGTEERAVGGLGECGVRMRPIIVSEVMQASVAAAVCRYLEHFANISVAASRGRTDQRAVEDLDQAGLWITIQVHGEVVQDRV